MKRNVVILAICILMLTFASCIKPDKAEKRAYDIAELTDFFDATVTDSTVWAIAYRSLTYQDVNERFPVEDVKANGYSVYSVKQGGNFYVFWAYTSFVDDRLVTDINENPPVDFVAYLSSPRDASMFDLLKADSSTAADVMAIDPSSELVLTMSSKIASYSYLDGENLLEIEYHDSEFDCYDDLIVKGITVVPAENAASRFSTILPEDLPG